MAAAYSNPSDMTPPPAAPAFLDRNGWADAMLAPLAGDASFRRYFRVHGRDGTRAVLMDAPPPHEDTRPFLAMADWLLAAGMRPPRVLARDADAGLVLLEDLGDRRMRDYLDSHPEEERAIYRRAVEELVRLRDLTPPALRPYDVAEYLREVRLLTEWFMPAAGLPAGTESYDAAWRAVLAPLTGADTRTIVVLRDYHAENIMLLDEPRLGLLDFQDALIGHPAYDLVSLLEDARRDVALPLEAEMLDHYCALTGEGVTFRRAYWLLGAQRNAKIIGIFTRLWRRDGKPRYLAYLPRMWRLLERDLVQPGLEPVRAWFDAHVPASARGTLNPE